jgi:DNA-binding FrmR family transcriptional regulator
MPHATCHGPVSYPSRGGVGCGILCGMKPEHKTSALNRLKTVRGHLDGVIAMVEDERYCPDVMKQVSALQSSLERVNRILLQNHLETCVTHAVAEGRTAEIVDELMETMKYTAAVTGPAPQITLEMTE